MLERIDRFFLNERTLLGVIRLCTLGAVVLPLFIWAAYSRFIGEDHATYVVLTIVGFGLILVASSHIDRIFLWLAARMDISSREK